MRSEFLAGSSGAERARQIVRLAAKHGGSVKEWLRRDEFGGWEKSARELLVSTAARAAELGLTADQVDSEIAGILKMLALKAMVNHLEKRRGKRAP